MSHPSDPQATYCPSCGAPITMGPVNGTCSFCGTVVERRGVRPAPRPAPPAAPAPSPRGCLAPLIVFVVLVLLVGSGFGVSLWNARPDLPSPPQVELETVVAVAIGQTSVSQPAEPPAARLGNVSKLISSVSRDAPLDDLLAYVSDGDRLDLVLLDGVSRQARWRVPALSKEANQGQTLVWEDVLFATDQEQLRALSLRDGSVIWQTSLVAEPMSPCEGCFALLGGRLLVLQKDGSLQAFDPRGGQLAWSRRLPGQTRHLPVLDGLPAVLVPAQGREAGRIELLDPASGEPSRVLTPRCGSDRREGVSVWSRMLLSPDARSFYIVLGSPSTCFQRWDSGADQPAWEVALESSVLPTAVDANDYLVTAQHLFLIGSDTKTVTVVDAASGAPRTLLTDEDYDKLPVLANERTLVLKTAPRWDSRKQALWAIDIASGERRWQFAADGAGFRPEGGFGDWGVYPSPQGLLVLQAPREGQQLTADLLNLETGVSSGRRTTALERAGSPVWQELRGDRLIWWDIGSSIYAIDPASGAVVYRLS